MVAIDGPAGAGKSTVARKLAARLNYVYVDSGAMYRAVTLKVLRMGVEPSDSVQVASVASDARIELVLSPSDKNETRVFLDCEDVTEAIRTPEINEAVPVVAANPGVRKCLLQAQRQLASQGGLVMDGRDIGTVVLPGADLKIYLTASLQERAARRCIELRAKGFAVDIEQVRQEIAQRDKVDSSRAVAPLAQASDAVVVDTTGIPVAEVVERILDICCGRM